jgi:uncharacterized protein
MRLIRLRLHSFGFALLAVCATLFPLHAETVKDMPAPTGYVTDLAGVLSQQSIAQLDQLCTEVDQQAHAQIAVVMVKTTEGEEIDQFSIDLATKWKIGPKSSDKGVLLLFATDDHKYRIEVGYGLEGALNDAKAGDIGRAMVPQLRAGDYDGAVALGVQQVAQIVAQDAGVTIADMPQQQAMDTEPAQQPVTPAQRAAGIMASLLIFGVLIYVLSHAGPRGLLWLLLANSLMGGGGRGGYGGGEGGGGGGGGFGGFGGGGFGGGGASGGW